MPDLVLLDEATHGTDEFYRERSQITKRLTALLDRRRHVDYLSIGPRRDRRQSQSGA
jgi:ABC-type molybdenum transport system ATPase subunit/photorepair protein PhrA